MIAIASLLILTITILTKIMNKKILLVFGIILLAAAAVFIFNRINRTKFFLPALTLKPTPATPISSSPVFIPASSPASSSAPAASKNPLFSFAATPAPSNKDWIKDGAVFQDEFAPTRTFKELAGISPILKTLGVNTIELFPIWDHPYYFTPEASIFTRWGVRDYSKLDPDRGTEQDLINFINTAHANGLKIVPVLDITTTFPPSNVCKNRLMPGYKLYYDTDGIGGAAYQYQMANPAKNILLKNLKGEFACAPTGFGFVTNQDSPDFIDYIKNIYTTQILNRNFDGLRLDAPVVNHCITGEKIDFSGKVYDCLDPVAEKHSPLLLYRQLRAMSPDNYVFLSEHTTTNLMFYDYQVKFPYYSSNPDMDEVADATEGYEFEKILLDILLGKVTPSGLTNWINNQPILYNRTRFRMIRNWNNIGKIFIDFVANDSRYYPVVTLASTIPGIPKVTDYELFGGEFTDKSYNIIPTNSLESRREYWKKILTIRNSSNALKYGDIKNVWKGGGNSYAYSRTYENETVIVLINFNGSQATSYLNLPFKSRTTLKDELSGETFVVSDPANFSISIPTYGARILTVKKDAMIKLPSVKIASVYESVNDGSVYYNRSVKDVNLMMKETNTEFILRGWFRWKPAPESPSEPVGFFTKEQIENNTRWGYTYEQLKEAITIIKKDNPSIIFTGAIIPIISAKERNPITGETFDRNKTWAMALDPGKWGIYQSKENIQCTLLKTSRYAELPPYSQPPIVNCPKDYDFNKVPVYQPDITNPQFQKLLLSWAHKQIDSGADAIWIDLLYTQANMFGSYALSHPLESLNALKASKDSYDAASKIVDEIHNYGYSKYGKYIYVGTWSDSTLYPHPQPNLDFVTVTPHSDEIMSKTFDEKKWKNNINRIKKKLGNIPIFAFIDWSLNDEYSLAVFSQKISPGEQANFLKIADNFFKGKGIIFSYPIHGGGMGLNPAKMAYGNWRNYGSWAVYDSLAPEFNTYATIKELANKKIAK